MTTPTWDEPGGPMAADDFRVATQAIMANIEQVIEGKSATVRLALAVDRKSTRLNSSHRIASRMPSSA